MDCALFRGRRGADCIVIPEIPYDPSFAQKILDRRAKGRHFTIIVCAEGAKPKDGIEAPEGARGAGEVLAALIGEHVDIEARVTVLGHIQRGSSIRCDRVLSTRYGVKAVEP